jgi:hypothetical protein
VLEDAAKAGNLDLVEAVMVLGANPNFRSVNRLRKRRQNALNKATAAGHVHVIDYLLKQGATLGRMRHPRKTAHPHDPAFSYPNVLHFAAGHGGATATAMLGDIVEIAPDLRTEALETAMCKFKSDAVHVLLHASTSQNSSSVRLYDIVFRCKDTNRDDGNRRKNLQTIDLVFGSDAH